MKKFKMNRFTYLTKIICIFFVLLIGFSSKAYAYLDPGTVTYVLTLIAGAIVGASAVVKQYWYKIKRIFDKDSNKMSEDDEDVTVEASNEINKYDAKN